MKLPLRMTPPTPSISCNNHFTPCPSVVKTFAQQEQTERTEFFQVEKTSPFPPLPPVQGINEICVHLWLKGLLPFRVFGVFAPLREVLTIPLIWIADLINPPRMLSKLHLGVPKKSKPAKRQLRDAKAVRQD